jgi:hypothetical protein
VGWLNDVDSPATWLHTEVAINKVVNEWQVQEKLCILCRVMPAIIVSTLWHYVEVYAINRTSQHEHIATNQSKNKNKQTNKNNSNSSRSITPTQQDDQLSECFLEPWKQAVNTGTEIIYCIQVKGKKVKLSPCLTN